MVEGRGPQGARPSMLREVAWVDHEALIRQFGLEDSGPCAHGYLKDGKPP